jgi:hypothetical protein
MSAFRFSAPGEEGVDVLEWPANKPPAVTGAYDLRCLRRSRISLKFLLCYVCLSVWFCLFCFSVHSGSFPSCLLQSGLAWLAPETFAVCHTGVTVGQPLEEDGGTGDDCDVVLQTVAIADMSSDFGATVTKVVTAHADRKRVGTAEGATQFCVRIPDWDFYSKWRSNTNPMSDELKGNIESYFNGGAVDVEMVSSGDGDGAWWCWCW